MAELKHLTLLHSNDMHGDFMAENTDDSLVGGVSMLSGYIDKVREEEDNIIYCIAGDMFRGSVIDSEFKGISTIEIMNMLAPDVVTLGNHEVDYGISHLLFIEKCAKFPIINANLHVSTNGARLFNPYFIKEIDGMKVLFIGILTEEVLSSTKSESLIGTLVDIDDSAKEVGKICNAYNATDIDLTVLLTHIGFEEDKQLASKLDPAWGVDIIIGGHSHTFIDEPSKVNDILIVQAGTGTDQIGRFDLMIDTDTNSVAEYKWQAVPIDSSHCPRDPELENLLSHFKETTDRKYGRVVTRLETRLTHPRRTQETSLGNLMADAVKNSVNVDIALVGSGSIRGEEMGPLVLYQDLVTVYPYDDSLHMVYVSGKQFRHMIKYMCRDEVWRGAHCEFYQLSEGLRITYNRQTHDFERFDFNGEPMDDEKIYSVALAYYHYMNFSDFFDIPFDEITANGAPRVLSTSCMEILDEYLSVNPHLYREVEGRLTVK